VIIGMHFEPIALESLSMGCVTYTEAFLPKGRWSVSGFKKAYTRASVELDGIRGNYLGLGWNIAYGTSGTVRAIAGLLEQRGGGALTGADSLQWLCRELAAGRTRLDTVPALRRAVWPAGLAILKAVFDRFDLTLLHVGDYALKEGLL